MQFDRKITITVGATRKATIWKPETLLLNADGFVSSYYKKD